MFVVVILSIQIIHLTNSFRVYIYVIPVGSKFSDIFKNWYQKYLWHLEVKHKYHTSHNVIVVLVFMEDFISERLCSIRIIFFWNFDLNFLIGLLI